MNSFSNVTHDCIIHDNVNVISIFTILVDEITLTLFIRKAVSDVTQAEDKLRMLLLIINE